MTDKQLKSFILRAGLIQTLVTLLVGALMWAYSVGQAQAQYLKKIDLVIIDAKVEHIQQDVATTKEDVAYIKGLVSRKLDNSVTRP